MAQHDYDINSSDAISGLQFRQDLNACLSAIKSGNSGATEPATPTAGMVWFDTSVSPAIFRYRNSNNNGWLPIGGGAILGATVPSATTTVIGVQAQGDTLLISGNTTITSFGQSVSGTKRTLIFSGTPVVTHNGTTLVCPGSESITIVSGTVLELVCTDGISSAWTITNIQHPGVSYAELAYLDGLAGVITGIQEVAVTKDSNTGVAYLPAGTTAQRPTLASNIRAIRYNTDLSSFEGWSGTSWGSLGGGATGGGTDNVFNENEYVVTTDYTIPAGKSAVTVGDANGDVTINAGVTVTLDSNSRWVVL